MNSSTARGRGLGGDGVAWFEANAGDAEAARRCLQATVARFGSVDILVNNFAASPYFGPQACGSTRSRPAW